MKLPQVSWRCALLLHAWPLAAMSSRSQSSDVTVLLFRTEQVQRLHLESAGAILQRCAACPRLQGPVSLDLKLQRGMLVDGTDRAVHELTLQGRASVQTGEQHRAAAAGRWRIAADHDRLSVQVEIPRERYVEAVLSAEANADEPIESLKALAIVARSFAAGVPARHEGDALCDTTHCQALRLESVRESVHEAVWSTSGETLWFASRQVPAYFSQNCGGFTESASAAWGGPMQPWLAAHADPWCARVPADWRASLSEAEVRRALALEGIRLPGLLESIVPQGRDRSGRIQQLRISWAGGTQTVGAAALRFALDRSLGWNQLRSDRYQVRRVGERFVFEGSGYGHGVGLCQAGAAAMARAGKNDREILRMYFPGATVRVRQADAGWIETWANGFTLRTTERNAALQADATAAFADARARWSRPVRTAPVLTVFPDTDAFRQATGQSGWTLAATEGSRIGTQPVAVLNAHGDARALFRHEFLHSFVEAQASTATPLWLREGLVEVLNGEPCHKDMPQTYAQVNASLLSSGSLQQAQQAHRAACALTQRYVREHGWDETYAVLQGR